MTTTTQPRRREPRRTAHASEDTLPPVLKVINVSGRRWFILGLVLLTIMGLAVWAAHRDPVAISALFFAIAAILRAVPKIMEERARILHEIERREARHAGEPGGDTAAAA